MTDLQKEAIREALARADHQMSYVDGMGGYGMGTLETLSSKVSDLQTLVETLLEIVRE